MNTDLFKKTPEYFKVTPHLTDYKSAAASISYDEIAKTEISWFDDGKLNAAYNAVDRHLTTPWKDKIALIWDGGNGKSEKFTFSQLAQTSNKIGNYLKSLGVTRGDRVFIFLPRIPYLYTSFLAILKIGAVAGSLFSAFQEQALLDRLENSEAKVLITTKELSSRLANIRSKLPNLKHVIIVDEPEFDSQLTTQSSQLEIEHMDRGDNAFMLYTSGTTGKPKGIVHHHYAIVSQHITAKYILDIHDEDIYWCTADPGWVTGISYTILGTWSNGVTSVVYNGRFDPGAWYKVLETYKVTIWYTAPTAVRLLMAAGLELPKRFNLTSLRHILSVGEPLNPEAITWGLKAYGLPFHDTWWQTETGAMMIANYTCMDIKIGSMGRPFPGITASIVDDAGNEVDVRKEGNIAIRPGWPSMMKTIWKNEEKYKSYFVNDWYLSGDHGWKDEDNYFWFIGRADDVIKTSGERVGPFEVESQLVAHPSVVEAGVIGKPDEMRGEIIKAFVVVKDAWKEKIKDPAEAQKLKDELSLFVKQHLAGHAYPREIEFIDKLPKTRSGKIMRRILKAKELGQPVGDTSTLEEY